MDHIRTGGYHLFYAAKETQKPILYLESKSSSDADDFFSIPVNPVWFNCEGVEARTTFKMGVEFMENADSEKVRVLLRKACGTYNPNSNWLQNLFLRYLCPLLKSFWGLFVWQRKDNKNNT